MRLLVRALACALALGAWAAPARADAPSGGGLTCGGSENGGTCRAPAGQPTGGEARPAASSAPIFSSATAVVLLSSASFDAEVARSTNPVLVAFYADWCHACREEAPALEWLAARAPGGLKVRRVDFDQDEALLAGLEPGGSDGKGSYSLPALFLYSRGKARGVRLAVTKDPGGAVTDVRFEGPGFKTKRRKSLTRLRFR